MGRRAGTLRAEMALKTLTTDLGPHERLRRVLEQALVFAGASFAGVYTPGDDADLLCLVESAGVPRTLYGLRDGYPASGGAPVAEARRAGHPVWFGPEELAAGCDARRLPTGSSTSRPCPCAARGAAAVCSW